MKKLSLLILLVFISWISRGQIDTIYTNFQIIPCTITNISELSIDYIEGNLEKGIARTKVKRIAAHSIDMPVKKTQKFSIQSDNREIYCKVRVTEHTLPYSSNFHSKFEIKLARNLSLLSLDFLKVVNNYDTSYFMDVYYHKKIQLKFRDTTQYRPTDLDTLLCYNSVVSGESCFNEFGCYSGIIYYDDCGTTYNTSGGWGGLFLFFAIDVMTCTSGYFYEPHYRVKLTQKEINAILNKEISAFKISQFEQALNAAQLERLRETMLCLVNAWS